MSRGSSASSISPAWKRSTSCRRRASESRKNSRS